MIRYQSNYPTMSQRFLLPTLVLLCTLVLPNLTSNYTLKAQSIDELLQSRGLTFEQAQQMAQNAGVDPNNPNEYQTPSGFEKYEFIEKRIKIKDEKDTVYQIKVSKHGPVMNSIIQHLDDERPIAMQWIYTKLENQLLQLSYQMSHSKSLGEFRSAASKLHAPGLNIMYGDAKNNIAWFASGQLYKYREGVNTKLVLDGASGDDEIIEYFDFEENPQAINPSIHYVYSANNQPDSIKGGLYPGYYLPEDRAKRIVGLLEAKNDFTKEDVAKMIYDVTSATAPTIIQNLSTGIDRASLSVSEKLSLDILQKWSGYYGKKEVAATFSNS